MASQATKVGIISCILQLLVAIYAGEAVSQNGDADLRWRSWIELYQSRKYSDLAASVEKDLRAAAPHPRARSVWCAAERALGQAPSLAAGKLDGTTRAALGVFPELVQAYRDKSGAAMLERFSAVAARSLSFEELEILADIAKEENRPLQVFDYLTIAARQAPGNFYIAWRALNAWRSDYAAVADLETARDKLLPLLSPELTQWLRRLMVSPKPTVADEAVLLDDWIARHPTDLDAANYRAVRLTEVKQDMAADTAMVDLLRVDPFRYRVSDHADVLVRLDRQHDARQALEREGLLRVPGQNREQSQSELLIAALRSGGERLAAERALGAALQRWPDDIELLRQQASLEEDNNRWQREAEAARKILVRIPADQSAYSSLVYALFETADPDGAIQARDTFLAAGGRETDYTVNWIVATLLKADRAQEAADIGSHWLINHKAQPNLAGHVAEALRMLGRLDDAIAAFRALFAAQPPKSYYVGKFVEALDAANIKIEPELTKLRAAWPRHLDVWSATATWLSNRDPDKSLRRSLWTEATTVAAPDIGDYWVKLADIDADEAPDKALDVLRRGRDAVAASLPSQRAAVLRALVSVATRAMKKRKIARSADLVADLLKDLDELKHLRQPLGEYHQARAQLFAVQDDKAAVRAETIAWAAADPGNIRAVWALCDGNISGVPRRESFGRLARLLERNPYDRDTLVDAAKLHARYGGSPIEARRIEVRADEADLSADSRSIIARDVAFAYRRLGNGQKDYLSNFDRNSSIGNSDRYVAMFDGARRAAQQPISEIRLDLDSNTAAIRSPDGMEITARWDPVVALMAYYKVGAAWIAAAYEATGGRLSRIWDSAGSDMHLEYDEKGNLTRIRNNDGSDLRMSGFDDHGRVTHLTLENVGSLEITYHSDGAKPDFKSSGSISVAPRIMKVFNEATKLEETYNTANFINPPELPFKDAMRGLLLDEVERAQSLTDKVRAALALVHHLIDHLADRRSHAEEAQDIASDVWDVAGGTNGLQASALEAMQLWRDLQLRLRPDGLPLKEWQRWNEMLSWLDNLKPADAALQTKAGALQAQARNAPLKLLAGHEWLPRSYIDNEGFWRRTALEAIVPQAQVGRVTPQAALVRRNGDLVVGTNLGLLVHRAGYWRWYGFDEVRRAWVPTPAIDRLHATSDVGALAEDRGGTLWIGTAGGLVAVAGADVSGPAQRITNELPVPRVSALAAWDDGVLVGTARGLRRFDTKGAQPLPAVLAAWSSREIGLLRNLPGETARMLIAGGDGSALLNGEQLVSLGKDRLVDGTWLAANEKLLLLYPDRLEERGLEPAAAARRLAGRAQITEGQRMTGLGLIPLEDGQQVPAVLSDTGLVFYRDNHFETKKLPLSEHIAGVQYFSADAGRSLIVSEAGIYVLEYGQVVIDRKGPVLDLLVDEDQGLTFVARGDRLDVVRHEAIKEGARPFASIAATHLAHDRKGALVTNDKDMIVRFAPGGIQAQELFRVEPSSKKGDRRFGRLSSLLVASDDTIWATYGASLFRWREGDQKPEEFSTYKDPVRFPARTDAVSRVVETVDGHIWVVASDEHHIEEQGEALSGGLLQWDGQKFQLIEEMDPQPWFMSSYTPLGDGSAIVGTSSGFARHRGNLYASIESSEEPSYLALKRGNPMLFLGTRGAKVVSDDSSASPIWLFGCAGGLVGYQGGRWFLPDRLNWMLPDQHLVKFGSRAVHAVGTDRAGHVYAGTDSGLLIYDTGGGDPASFLTSKHLTEAFAEVEQEKQRVQSQVLLSAVASESKIGRTYARYSKLNQQIDRLREEASGGARLSMAAPPRREDEKNRQSVRRQLAQAELDKHLLLSELEHDPLLRGELRLEPLDLVALRKQLPERDIVVQILPTKNLLYINLVRHDRVADPTTVKVARADLYKRVALVTDALTGRSPLAPTELIEHLHFLYENLLAPVEGQLDGSEHVYITGAGPLAYLPFGALVRGTKPTVEYAVSRWNMGYIPSLFLLEALRRRNPGIHQRTLIMADPDGNLKGAEDEARSLYSLKPQAADLKLGPQANLQTLKELGPSARLIHFATHAHLDPTHPEKSYILLADKVRLTAADLAALDLDLSHTDLVVLSACESGIGGKDGLEFATLARGFAHAGVPSILATLWKVKDEATSRLVQAFYKIYSGDTYMALANAQRNMIKMGGPFADPSAWGGFIALGRP